MGLKFYKKLYDENYFNGKKSFFYKFGYKDSPNFWDKRLEIILKFKNKGNALDVGCAFGFLLKRLSKHFDVYGFDVSEYAIKIARQNVPNAHLKVWNAEEKFPFRKNFFDIITCVDIIEHLKLPDNLIKNIYRCLKKDGILFLSTPNYNFIRKTIFCIPDTCEHHVSMMSNKILIKKLQDCGFTIEKFWTNLSILNKELLFNNNYGLQSIIICKKN